MTFPRRTTCLVAAALVLAGCGPQAAPDAAPPALHDAPPALRSLDGRDGPASGETEDIEVADRELATGRDVTVPDPPARPTRVSLPSIGVDASVIGLDLRDDGTIEVPPDGADTGWYQDGSRAGEPGPTVIGAHVDWDGRPGVFADLERLVVGDVVTVTDADGTPVRYRVDGTARHAKEAFPTFDVYGTTPADTLRLVTCAGPFDATARTHRDNLVVFAIAID